MAAVAPSEPRKGPQDSRRSGRLTSVRLVTFLRLTGEPAEVVESVRAWLALGQDEAPPVLIETSGSTGAPKRVVLSRAAVLASATATAARLGAQGPWLLALPAAYVAGLQVVVRSLLAGHEPVLVGATGSIAESAAKSDEPTFTSLVSTQLRRLLDDPREVDALRRLHTILVGGGPVDLALRERAAAEGLRIVATYGASETAGGCVYDGLPLDGVAVALSERGQIRIAGPTLFEGYADDPALTASTLIDGWFHTSDAGRLDPDGRLVVTGRLDSVVISGGVKISADAVARRLALYPGVQAAEVIGVPDDEWGQRVVAFVVPHAEAPDRSVELADLRDWVAAIHPREWAPRQLVTLDELPRTAKGKVDRAALEALS